MSIRIPAELKEVLERIAEESGRSLADIVITVLDDYAQQVLPKE